VTIDIGRKRTRELDRSALARRETADGHTHRPKATRAMLVGLVVRVAIGSAITWALYSMQGRWARVRRARMGRPVTKPILDLVLMLIGGLRSSAFPDWKGDVHLDTHQLRVCSVGGYP
jgi:hypothetical protein